MDPLKEIDVPTGPHPPPLEILSAAVVTGVPVPAGLHPYLDGVWDEGSPRLVSAMAFQDLLDPADIAVPADAGTPWVTVQATAAHLERAAARIAGHIHTAIALARHQHAPVAPQEITVALLGPDDQVIVTATAASWRPAVERHIHDLTVAIEAMDLARTAALQLAGRDRITTPGRLAGCMGSSQATISAIQSEPLVPLALTVVVERALQHAGLLPQPGLCFPRHVYPAPPALAVAVPARRPADTLDHVQITGDTDLLRSAAAALDAAGFAVEELGEILQVRERPGFRKVLADPHHRATAAPSAPPRECPVCG